MKVDVSERMAIDHIWNVDTATDGYHKQVSMLELGADPTAAANYGIVYTKDVSGVTHLFFRSADSVVRQITGAITNATFPWASLTGIPAVLATLGDLTDPGSDSYLYWNNTTNALAFAAVTPSVLSGYVEAGALSSSLPAGWSVSLVSSRYRVTHSLTLADPKKLRVSVTKINNAVDTDVHAYIETITADYFDVAMWDNSDGHLQTDLDFFFLAQVVA
jgi:hypothetical protein